MDFDKKSPIYQQLAQQIRQAILSGDLMEGEPIPSVRQIAVEHGLNPQTVLNATGLLVQEELIEKRRGLGLFVSDGARKRLLKKELKQFRDREVVEFATRSRRLGISLEQLIQWLTDIYGEK